MPCVVRGLHRGRRVRTAFVHLPTEVSKMSNIFAPDTDAAIVRYQVVDPERSLSFYTEQLGFHLVQRAGPLSIVSRGDLHVLLSGPGASVIRTIPVVTAQPPAGWTRTSWSV